MDACDTLLDVVLVGQRELLCRGELDLIQLDFSAAFDHVSHVGLIYNLQNAGIGGPILRGSGIFYLAGFRELKLMV